MSNKEDIKDTMNCPLDGVHCQEPISCKECTDFEIEHRLAWLVDPSA